MISFSYFKQCLIQATIVTVLALNFSIPSVGAATFPDVSASNKNFAAVEFLVSTSTIQGYPDGNFLPLNTVNRAELMKILVAGQGYELNTTVFGNCFPDVANDWYAPYVCFAYSQGWVDGYPDGLFRPENTVNRVEALKMSINAMGLGSLIPESVTDPLFEDTDSAAWYGPYLYLSKVLYLIEEQAGYYHPADGMERGVASENIFRTTAAMEEAENQCEVMEYENCDEGPFKGIVLPYEPEQLQDFLEDHGLDEVWDEIQEAQETSEQNEETSTEGDDADGDGASSEYQDSDVDGYTDSYEPYDDPYDEDIPTDWDGNVAGADFQWNTNGAGRVWYGYSKTYWETVNESSGDEYHNGTKELTGDEEWTSFRIDEIDPGDEKNPSSIHYLVLTEVEWGTAPYNYYYDYDYPELYGEVYDEDFSGTDTYSYPDEKIDAGMIYQKDEENENELYYWVYIPLSDLPKNDGKGHIYDYYSFSVGDHVSQDPVDCATVDTTECSYFLKNGVMEGSFSFEETLDLGYGTTSKTIKTMEWNIVATTCVAFEKCTRPSAADDLNHGASEI